MNKSPLRVLLIEDEGHIRGFLRISLRAQNYEVHEAQRGNEGILLAGEISPHLIILDLGLPDMNGQDVIKKLREWSDVPILVLSVRDSETEKVAALDAGANDYVEKPAGISELMARVRVLLRTPESSNPDSPVIQRGSLRMDLARRVVTLQQEPIHLTPKEYDLLRLLARRNGRILTHQQALHELWGPTYTSHTHYLRILVSALRQKLGDDPTNPQYIVTEQGIGYRLP